MAKILFVDDDTKLLEILGKMLKSKGHEVSKAESGAEAKRIITDGGQTFDLVVADMWMERQHSGLDVLKNVKSCSPTTEVIVLTGYKDDVACAVQSLQAGAYTYIEKDGEDTLVFDILITQVERALKHRRQILEHVAIIEFASVGAREVRAALDCLKADAAKVNECIVKLNAAWAALSQVPSPRS